MKMMKDLVDVVYPFEGNHNLEEEGDESLILFNIHILRPLDIILLIAIELIMN